MKKYIIPTTETFEMIRGSVLCDPSAGSGQQSNPAPVGPPQGAPMKWIF